MDNQLQPGGIISPTNAPTPGPSPEPNSNQTNMVVDQQDSHEQPNLNNSPQESNNINQNLAQPTTPSTDNNMQTNMNGQPPMAPSVGLPTQSPENNQPAQNTAAVNNLQPNYQQTNQSNQTQGQMQSTQPMPAFMNAPGTVPGNPQPNFAQNPAQPMLNPKKSKLKKSLMPFVIILLVVVLVGGGSAAAYFGIILPNKPENKLLSAMGDLVSETNISMDGTVDYKTSDSSANNASSFKISANTAKNQFSTSGSIAVEGNQYPFELRYLDKSIFMKVGGLDKLPTSVTNSLEGSDFGSVINKVNNQWYVIDSSFADSLGVKTSCYTDIPFAFSKDDTKLISSTYKQHPLFKIKSSSDEQVDGTATTKYLVDPTSDKEATAFVSAMKDLSIVKKIKACLGSAADNLDTSSVTNTVSSNTSGDTYTLAIYVSKDKKLKKIELDSSGKSGSFKIQGVMSYAPVNITKPDAAKSINDLYTSIFGASTNTSSVGMSNNTQAQDTERQTDIKALHGQLEAYWAVNGYYPSLSDMNNPTFVAANLAGLDKEAFKDPAGTNYTLVANPQSNAYAYQVSPANCDNSTKTQCTGYTLTATLSDGTTYTKQSLNN